MHAKIVSCDSPASPIYLTRCSESEPLALGLGVRATSLWYIPLSPSVSAPRVLPSPSLSAVPRF